MKYFLTVLIFLSCSSSQTFNEKPPETSPKECFVSTEEIKEWSEKTNNQYLKNPGLEIIYDNSNLQPFLVVYKLQFSTETHTLKRKGDYNSKFRPDPRVLKSAKDKNYKKSGFDRGHLAPAGDFCYSVEAAESTFLFSNISPQDRVFNQSGAWNKLEILVRKISQNGLVQVVAGPIVTSQIRLKDDSDGPSIPQYFFKIVIRKINGECKYISFVFKNNSESKDYCKDKESDDLVPEMVKSHLSSAKKVDICRVAQPAGVEPATF